MINVHQLVKRYPKSDKNAVNNLSFNVRKGEIFGLLGPNGAGKTSTLRCLSTLIKPTEGFIELQGMKTTEKPSEIRKNITFLTNDLKLDGHFTPDYTMKFYGALYGLEEDEIEKRQTELFKIFNIESYKNKKIQNLSTGMSQKLSIAVSLIHNPDIIIFDEPTSGLDILTARQVMNFLFQLKEEGKTIIISSHNMSVIEKLCDRILVILEGEEKMQGTLEEIYVETGKDNLEDAFFYIYEKHGGIVYE